MKYHNKEKTEFRITGLFLGKRRVLVKTINAITSSCVPHSHHTYPRVYSNQTPWGEHKSIPTRLAYLLYQTLSTLPWRHNDHDSVSNHQPHGCLLNRLFRRRSKKTSKLRVTGLCVGNSPGPVNSPHKGPVTRKMFPFDDVIMIKLVIHFMKLYYNRYIRAILGVVLE